MAKIKVAIIGASGYTGVELMRILVGHPEVELTAVTSRQYVGQPVAELFPSLRDVVDLKFMDNQVAEIAGLADLVFTALPHKTAIEVVAELHKSGKKVVDLSADYRFSEQKLYEKWYQPHTAPKLLAEAVYGLPELFRDQIPSARVVGNPGCYPTSVILPLAPILPLGLVDPDATIVIDAKSGTSGAGRSLNLGSLYCEVNENFKPYKVANHRHQPEMMEQLGRASGVVPKLLFVPHLLPVNRGILSSIYLPLSRDVTATEIEEALAAAYGNETFVRLLPAGSLPTLNAVRGSNYCDIGYVLAPDQRSLILFSAIDNLVKGAAGAAIQNMNLMLGLPEEMGLLTVSLVP